MNWDVNKTRWYMKHFDKGTGEGLAFWILIVAGWFSIMLLSLIIIQALLNSITPTEPQSSPTVVVDSRPTMCDNMYNVGKHREWAECMGVGYVTD